MEALCATRDVNVTWMCLALVQTVLNLGSPLNCPGELTAVKSVKARAQDAELFLLHSLAAAQHLFLLLFLPNVPSHRQALLSKMNLTLTLYLP